MDAEAPGHPDVLAAERKERARSRSEKGIRRGGRPLSDAARPGTGPTSPAHH